MRNRLLVVDGEPRGLRVLDVSLRGAGFEVVTASDGLQAWALLETKLPDLVICDAELPGLDGFGLCARLRRTPAGAALPFLMTSTRKSRDLKIRALEAGADDFLPKPAYIKEVIARIRALLQRRDREALLSDRGAAASERPPGTSGPIGASPFTGDLADISVVDLVQLIEGNGRSGIVHLHRPSGAPGFLYFRGGKVIDAEAGRLSGLDALSRLFSWTAGTFEVEWKNIRRKDAIERLPSELVIEGMQRLDAWNELRGQLDDPNAVFEVNYRLLAERLAEIPDEVNGILRLCDGARPVMQVVEESSLPDTEALTALLRLHAEGILHERAPRTLDAAGSAPRPTGLPAGVSSRFKSGAERQESSMLSSSSGEQSVAGHLEGTPPPPAVPRRTSPGLGQRAPSVATPAEVTSALEPDREVQQDNVIQFPTPVPSTERGASAHPHPTRVGFEPATRTPSTPASESTSATDLDAPPVPFHPSMTLPLGLAEQAGVAREQLLRALDAARALDDHADPAAPALAVSMTDTQRGVGAPAASQRNEASAAHASAVPIEIPESPSRASKRSGPVSEPTGGPAGERAAPGPSGRVRASTDEPVSASGVVANGASAPVAAAGPGSGPRSVPRPGDSTVRVNLAEDAISRRDALDELGLPSRGRGLRVLAGGLVFGVLAAVGVTRFVGSRTHLGTIEENVPVAAAPPAPSRQSEAVVVPAAPVGPAGAAPDVELPGTAPVKAAETKSAGEHASPGAVDPHAAADPAPTPVAAPEPAARAEPAETAPATSKPVSPGPPLVVPSAAPSPPALAGKAEAAGPDAASPATTAARQLAACRTAFAKNRLREAMASCSAAAAANPRSAEVLTMLAHTELNRGNLERANDLAVRAVAIDPTLADAYVIIGGVHQDSGQNKEAKAAYHRYLELSPRGRYADELRSIVNGL